MKPKTAPPTLPLWNRLTSRRSLLLAVVLLVTVTAVTFSQVPLFDFVYYDDNVHVFQNPYFVHFGLNEFVGIWRHAYGELYIPVSYTVFGLLTLLARLPVTDPALTNTGALFNPHVFHTANLLLHLSNVVLTFLLIRRLTRQDLPALLGTMVFAVHPLQVESVAWISEMRGLLSATLSLLSIHYYLTYVDREEQRHRGASGLAYAACLVAAVLAMLAKPSAVVLGPIIAAFGIWGCNRSWKTVGRESLPLLAVGGILVLVASHVQTAARGQEYSAWLRPFIIGDALSFYLWKLLFPFHLAIDYGRRPTWVLSHVWAYAEWIIPAAVAATAYALRKTAPYVAFGVTLSTLFLLPVSGVTSFVFQGISTVADRYVYLAMLGVAVVVAYAFIAVPVPYRRTAGIAVLAWAAVLAAFSFRQTLYWRNSDTLYSHAIAVNPASAPAQNGLGKALQDRGEYQSALLHYRRAAELDPTLMNYQYNLGLDDEDVGDYTDAERRFRRCTAMAPNNAAAHSTLGKMLMRENRHAEAIPELTTALRLNPSDISAVISLGGYYTQAKDYPDAVVIYSCAVKYSPDNPTVWQKLGLSLCAENKYAEAEPPLATALNLDPSDKLTRDVLTLIHQVLHDGS